MSRCFPYPPPGYYIGKRASNLEALIESIKLPREREEAKAERKKEKKRERKEKKREKQEKAKQNSSEIGHVVKAHKGKSWVDLKGGYNEKRKEEDAEQLERSGLTEEHEQPLNSHNPCYSSDSTQNSKKRRRHEAPFNGGHSHGNIIRIRLPLQKHKEPDASAAGKEQQCSTSGRTDLPVPHKYEIVPGASRVDFCSASLATNPVMQGIPLTDRDLTCSTSGTTEIFAQDDLLIGSGSTPFENEIQRASSLYKDLIENWVPPALQLCDFDDQEWLFGRNHLDKQGGKRLKASSDISCCGSSTLWPCAQYLPEADINALPYTLPF